MSCRSDEEDDAAPPPPGFSMPTKAIRNDGAGHAEPDAEGMQTEFDANVEKQFDESTGKKRKYSAYLNYTEVKRWSTSADSVKEPADINHEIYTPMKKFMQQSRLMKAPGHKELPTDIGLWKQYRVEYFNWRTDDWIQVMKCPLKYQCKRPAQLRIIAGKYYKLLELFGTHDENRHSVDS